MIRDGSVRGARPRACHCVGPFARGNTRGYVLVDREASGLAGGRNRPYTAEKLDLPQP
jgi:hypothetical protein